MYNSCLFQNFACMARLLNKKVKKCEPKMLDNLTQEEQNTLALLQYNLL